MDGEIMNMKSRKNMKWIYGLIGIMLMVVGCEDNRMADMVDDKIYLLDAGISTMNVIKWPDTPFELIAIKSGIGKQSGMVRLVADQNVLDDYNEDNGTNFRMIPDEYFTIVESEKTVASSDYRISFEIDIDVEKIEELENSSDEKFVLSFRLSVISGELQAGNDEEMVVIMEPNFVDPYISFSRSGLLSGNTVIDFDSPDEIVLFSGVELNFTNKWDIDFGLTSDASLVEQYNQQHGTSYKLLDSDGYRIDEESLTIRDFEIEHAYKIVVDKKSFEGSDGNYKFGDYLIPLKLTSVSRGNIHPEYNYQMIPVSFRANQLDRSNWEIVEWNSCICDEPQYDGLERVPENILDGDNDSFWGSTWDEPVPMPYYIIMDMKFDQAIYQIDLIKPETDSWRGNLKSGHFEISDDGETWRKFAEWEMNDDRTRKHTFMVSPVKGRYVKWVVNEAFTYSDAGSHPGEGAQVDLAEFVVWGE